MGLFLIELRHTPDLCPRKNPEMVRELANHVSQASADKVGVRLIADFVYEPEHTLTLVLEADNPEQAAAFSLPFLKMGSVTVKEGQSCSDIAFHTLEFADTLRTIG